VAETPTARVVLPVQASLGRPEHHEWRRVSAGEALSLSAARLQGVIKWAAGLIGSSV